LSVDEQTVGRSTQMYRHGLQTDDRFSGSLKSLCACFSSLATGLLSMVTVFSLYFETDMDKIQTFPKKYTFLKLNEK
jgi:hypothetical protein